MNSILEESRKSRGVFNKIDFKSKKKIIIIVVVCLVVAGGAYAFFGGQSADGQTEVQKKEWTVRQDDLRIAIESDGKVVAKDGVELSFSVSGDTLEVKDVYVQEGQNVKKGDKIASVQTDTLQFNVRSAYASYQSALASYNEKMAGATEDEIDNAKASVKQAELNLSNAKISLEKTKLSAAEKIKAAEKAVEDAKDNLEDNQDELTSRDVQEAYEDMVSDIKSINISLEGILLNSDKIIGVDNTFINDDYEDFLGVKDVSSMNAAVASYKKAKSEKNDLNDQILSLNDSSSYFEIDQAAKQTKNALDAFENHLYDMKVLLEASIISTDLTQTELDSFKSTISSNRTTINTKISTLNTAEEAVEDAKDSLEDYKDTYNDAVDDLANTKTEAEQDIATSESSVTAKELSLEQAKRDYNDLMAPLTTAELASARSSFTSAAVSLEKAQAELDKATLTSPIDGVVAMLNYAPGDIILDSSNSDPVVTIINNNTLFIEVNIEEADINKIKVGQKAYATFDALDELKLEGEISFISLTSDTSSNGIVTYLVRVLFDNPEDQQVREGMTAYVDFVTAEANNVLIIPVDAVHNVNGSPSVEMANGEIRKISTGFTDGDNVEVISGLEAGEKITY